MLEPNPVNAFRMLQEFHNQWREIGPVPQNQRMKSGSASKRPQARSTRGIMNISRSRRMNRRKNLEAKIALCEEVEAINLIEIKSFKDFDDNAEKIVSLRKCGGLSDCSQETEQQGLSEIQEACDAFFEKKRLSMPKTRKPS
jgi:hypothetical protein